MIHGMDIEKMMYPRTSEEKKEMLKEAEDYLLNRL